MYKFLGVLIIMVGTMFAAEDKVLATVGSLKITQADFDERMGNLPAQYASYYSSAEGREKMLEQLVNEKVIYLEAKAASLEKNPEVVKAIEKAKEELITSYFIKKEMAKINVTDKEIKEYYDKNKDEFTEKEAVRASHILVDTEDEAKEVLKDLKNGKDFAEEAKEKSKCPSSKRGGDLDFFTSGQMVKEFESAAFKLDVGETTKEPVKTQYGYHIIKITDHRAATKREFDEVKQDIRNELMLQAQKNKLNDVIEKSKKKYTISKPGVEEKPSKS